MRVVTAATWNNTVLHTDCEKQRLRLLAAAATRDRDRLHFFVFFFPKESVGGNEQRCEHKFRWSPSALLQSVSAYLPGAFVHRWRDLPSSWRTSVVVSDTKT